MQVQDYRKTLLDQGSTVSSVDAPPIINRVCLRMSLENVVKDIPSISDNSWTYGDLMVSGETNPAFSTNSLTFYVMSYICLSFRKWSHRY